MADPVFPFDARHVVDFHEACLDFGKWPDEEAPAHPPGDIWPWVEANHAANAHLANAPTPPGPFEAQRRESLERLDAAVHAVLAHRVKPSARLHAQTPAALIDGLSKLALAIRAAVSDMHGEAGDADGERVLEGRVAELEAQRRELVESLARLLRECAAGHVRFA